MIVRTLPSTLNASWVSLSVVKPLGGSPQFVTRNFLTRPRRPSRADARLPVEKMQMTTSGISTASAAISDESAQLLPKRRGADAAT